MSSSQEATEIDSEGSSCEERESVRHRVLGDCSDSSGIPKKRRKQSTPIKFSTTPLRPRDERNDDEDDNDVADQDNEMDNNGKIDEDDDNNDEESEYDEQHQEGKPLPSSLSKSVYQAQDENLNNEFRCQYCSQFFDSRVNLKLHLECEHNSNLALSLTLRQQEVMVASSSSPPPLLPSRFDSPEHPNGEQQSISPINLSGISIRNFASNASWLPNENPLANMRNNQPHLLNHHLQHFPSTGFPGPLSQFLPMPPFPLTDSSDLGKHMGSGPIMTQMPKIFNREAYCSLCNRELCNKYFLKTHMANKHGINIDATPGQSQQQPQQQSNDISSTRPLPSLSSSPLPTKLIPDQPLRLDSNGIAQQQQPSLPCDMCPKRFKNDDSLRNHRNKIHLNISGSGGGAGSGSESADSNHHASLVQANFYEEDGHCAPGGMEALFRQEFNIEQEELAYAPIPRSVSPQSVRQLKESSLLSSTPVINTLSDETLRRLGVMNPEAFCELCCKEYCNKYFLRVHKLKRHGNLSAQDATSTTTERSPSWHQVQTSPLNLIMSDSLGSESGDRSVEDHACKACGISFQNQELYKLHMERIHENDECEVPLPPSLPLALPPPPLQLSLSPKQELLDSDTSVDQRSEQAISEDLRKLQTMILQLNGLESNKAATCVLCGRDYESPMALKNHMLSEHRILSENLSSSHHQQSQLQLQQSLIEKSSPSGLTTVSNQVYCPVCEKDFSDQDALRRHIAEDHKPSTPTSNSIPQQQQLPTTPKTSTPQHHQQGERKLGSSSLTPTSSYCEICNKELCNKYFMKTHMQKMHGIEIENGAQIGGVVCNICKKELCSKYFLRVHKQNTHGIVDDASSQQQSTSAKQDSLEQPSITNSGTENFDTFDRYVTHFQEICPICHQRFRSPKWLKVHMQNEHGKPGMDKWREIERNLAAQQQQQTIPNRPTPARVPSVSRGIQQQSAHGNINLKIPNGLDPSQQIKAELASLGNQVLSNFFGGTSDDQQKQIYHCSQPNCSFSTPILPLFFLHERSHNPQNHHPPSVHHHQESLSVDIPEAVTIQCPICHQGFSQPDLLQQHILTRHPNPFPGLLPQFPIPLLNELVLPTNNEQLQKPHDSRNDFAEPKEEATRLQPNPQIMNEIDTNRQTKKQEENNSNAVQVMPQGTYKCSQCGYATANLNRIKKHVKRDHKSLGDPVETALAELTKTLKDVANKHKVPASYAVPQDSSTGISTNPDKTIMQPFIIEELMPSCHLRPPLPQNGGGNNKDNNEIFEDNNDNNTTGEKLLRTFAPALVFLPVKTRLSGSLTTSFTLNPA